jgi:hypothetical protein
VAPGGTISFQIAASAPVAGGGQGDEGASAPGTENGEITTTLTPSAETPAFSPPVLTVAGGSGDPGSSTIELPLPTDQPATPQIEAQVSVPATAPAGETIQFSATVSVAGRSGSPLTATGSAPAVAVATAGASPSPAPSTTSGGGAAGSSGSTPSGSAAAGSSPPGTTSSLGATLPVGALPVGALPVGALPVGAIPVGALAIGSLAIGSATPGKTIDVPAGNAANLFPEISPSAVASAPPATAAGGTNPGQGQTAAVTSSVVPISLTSSEFKSQLIGLIVLLLGIAAAVAGISVRKVRAAVKPRL